jgi:hypothetical protein
LAASDAGESREASVQAGDAWETALEAFVAELIPTDDEPGAAEAGTAAAVLQALAALPEQEAVLADGCRALDRASQARCQQPFAALPDAERQALMAQLARGIPPAGWTAGDPRPERFWATVRGLAVSHFYGSPLGHALFGFPGPAVDRGGYRHTIVDPDPLRRGHEP